MKKAKYIETESRIVVAREGGVGKVGRCWSSSTKFCLLDECVPGIGVTSLVRRVSGTVFFVRLEVSMRVDPHCSEATGTTR